jgi:hypothetical protein
MPTGHDARAPPEADVENDMRKTFTAAGFAMIAMTLAALPVQAASPDFCRDYATAAMNQIRAALANPGCVAGVRGPRWVQNERIHFQWCLTQPVPMVESERGARTAYLHACRG